ncbi:MAG: glycosyltransferase [Solirubrobacterales bacterium]
MIAFGCSITNPELYERCALPGIRLASEPDSELLAQEHAGTLFRSYNLLLDLAAERDDLEALVLMHQDAEIVDPDFCAKLRGALSDPEVALVGSGGAVGVRSIAWWQGSVTWASFTTRYEEFGGGEVPGLSWYPDRIPPYARTGEVDSIDGFVIGMSPWAVRELRFDESLGKIHGYDFDLCCQARAAGRKVVTADLRVVHHHSLDLIGDVDAWVAAHMRVAEKWDGRLPGVGSAGGDWRQRARRAEAEAAAAQLIADLGTNYWAPRAQLLERELRWIKSTRSWRLSGPLRALRNRLRRRG